MLTPTDAELAILRALWTLDAATVRAVHEHLGRAGAYTTTLKTMQIMHEKGLVERDTRQRSHIYRAAVERDAVERTLVTELSDKVFGGSAARLALRALSLEPASAEDIDALRALIDRHDRGEKS